PVRGHVFAVRPAVRARREHGRPGGPVLARRGQQRSVRAGSVSDGEAKPSLTLPARIEAGKQYWIQAMFFPKRVPLGWLNLVHRKGRFAVSLAGISFAVVLMFVQLGFQNALYDSTVQLIQHLRADLVLLHNTKTSLNSKERFPLESLRQADGVEGVDRALPLYIEVEPARWRGVPFPVPSSPPLS